MNNIIYYFISGILIGTGMILPGVSGSIIAIMLGVYEYVIYIINTPKFNIILKIKELTPIVIGIIFGIIVFGRILLIFYNKYSFYMMYIFIGLIFGSIPSLIYELKKNNHKLSIPYLTFTLIFSLLFLILKNNFNFNSYENVNFIKLFVGGFLYISGKIIPGVSSSLFLMILGLYDYFLLIVTNLFNITLNQFIDIFEFLCGALSGLFIVIKLVNFLLKNHFSKAYSGIIGFVIGSAFSIFPGFKFELKYIFGMTLMLLSFEIVKKMSKKL